MKRITIVVVLAFISAVATGCIGQSGTEAGTDESSFISGKTRAVASGDEETAGSSGSPAQALESLELRTHPSGENQGPHPEPWIDTAGPHPEPWSAKLIKTETGSTGGTGTDPGNGKGKP